MHVVLRAAMDAFGWMLFFFLLCHCGGIVTVSFWTVCLSCVLYDVPAFPAFLFCSVRLNTAPVKNRLSEELHLVESHHWLGRALSVLLAGIHCKDKTAS